MVCRFNLITAGFSSSSFLISWIFWGSSSCRNKRDGNILCIQRISRHEKNWQTNCLAFLFASVAVGENTKAGHVHSIHLPACLRINIFSFVAVLMINGVFAHLWGLMRCATVRGWRDVTLRRDSVEIGQRFWISIINGSFHFSKDTEWVKGRTKGKHEMPNREDNRKLRVSHKWCRFKF